ncbi:hypothetical protein [Scytonema hofmannii]|nr:hypothetical protein [Scytonema hofmannii]
MYATRLETPPEDYLVVIPSGLVIVDAGIYDTRHINKPMGVHDLCDRMRISDRTLCIYREIAWENCPDYAASVQERNPFWMDDVLDYYAKVENLRRVSAKLPSPYSERLYQAGKRKIRRVFPDRPDFTPLEAKILIAIGNLFKNHRRLGVRLTRNNKRFAVAKYVKSHPNFWREIEEELC